MNLNISNMIWNVAMCFKQKKFNKWVILIAGIHTLLTFYSDKFFFVASAREHWKTVIFLKVLLFFLLIRIWDLWFKLAERNKRIVNIIVYAIPYGFFLLVYLFLNHAMRLYSDELNIYNQVINYNLYPYHFTYITGIVYALSYLLVPCQIGIVIIKIFFQSVICGYCVYRFVDSMGKKGLIIYLLFFLNPVLENSIMVHRMHFYGLLFLFVMVKLLFDYRIYNREMICSKQKMILLMILFSILAIWRKEGIYLVIMTPVLLCVTYKIWFPKDILWICISFAVVLATVYFPEKIGEHKFTQESGHTYNSWIVNMCREGLDKDKYSNEMAAIDKYISIDAIDYINEQLGDENYQDEYIAWREGYVGVRDRVSREDYLSYTHAVKTLIFKEPWIFIKTRIGCWKYMTQTDFSTLKNGIVSLMENMNIPLLVIILANIYGFIRRKWLLFLLSGMTIAHGFVTLIFSPAAYTKYYYQLYLFGWLLIFWMIIHLIAFLQEKISYKLLVEENKTSAKDFGKNR